MVYVQKGGCKTIACKIEYKLNGRPHTDFISTSPSDMKIMTISVFSSEVGREKGTNMIFHVILLNNDISITVLDIVLEFHVFFLCPSFYFM